jgi:hypothetical protein
MPFSRRHFLSTLGVGAAATASGAPLHAAVTPPELLVPITADWDVSWTDRVNGKFRGVFDSPEIHDGAALFRAIFWRDQYKEVYGTPPEEMSAVLVIRHAAIAMVMNDAFWADHQIAKAEKIKDQVTKKWATVNPFRVAPADTPPQWAKYSLEAFMQSGGIVLACNLAFNQMVGKVAEKEKLKGDAARARALESLIPGVILQPSGVFAAMRAQQAGCHYMMGS